MRIFREDECAFQTRQRVSNASGMSRTAGTTPSGTKRARKPLTPHTNRNLRNPDSPSRRGKPQSKGQLLSNVYGKENRGIMTPPRRSSLPGGAGLSSKENLRPASKLSSVGSLRRDLRGTMLSPSSKKEHAVTSVLRPPSTKLTPLVEHNGINSNHDFPSEKSTTNTNKLESSSAWLKRHQVTPSYQTEGDAALRNDGKVTSGKRETKSLLDTELERFKIDESLLISPEESHSTVKMSNLDKDELKGKIEESSTIVVEEAFNFKSRGNGVQMDLSHVFASASPGPQTTKSHSRLLKSHVATTMSHPPTQKMSSKSPREAQTSPQTANVNYHEIDTDEWAQKQCDSFTKWLNFKFHPTEDEDHSTETSSQPAFCRLLLYQRMTRVRLKALELFNDEEMTRVQQLVNDAVSTGRLSVREDRDMYADLTLRKKALSLLMSYSLPWLRLGLETLCGETISPDQKSSSTFKRPSHRTNERVKKDGRQPMSRMARTLRDFIVSRVLSDPEILFKYTKGKCKVPSGNFEKLYRAEIRKHALFRILVLIIFLDRAKLANVTEKVPNLFVKEAAVKSSREVLVALCRDFLSSEGDIVKHLLRMGLKVSYKQDRLDELDFTVFELAVDLRDGVRLARLTEILQGGKPKSLLAKLRLPANSLQRKFYNVDLVLASLRRSGVPIDNDVMSHHIVYGHRQIVLDLLWSVLSFFEFESLLDVDVLKQEIRNVQKSNRQRKLLMPEFSHAHALEQCLVGPRGDLKSLLLRWCQEVCSCFGVVVEDFTSSFADGKVMCLLLHYYHPGFLMRHEILPTTRDMHLPPDDHSEEAFLEALKREQKNSSLAARKISELGGVPHVLPTTDSENTPEARSVLISLAFLCSRLMESSKEALAAIAIQGCCRKYLTKITRTKKHRAASVILGKWREHKEQYFRNRKRKYQPAVLVIEAFVLRMKPSLFALRRDRLEKEGQTNAAIVLQKLLRQRYATRKVESLILRHSAATCLQSFWRSLAVQRQHCAVIIQSCWRRQNSYCRFLKTKDCAIAIQSWFRGACVRQLVAVWHASAVQIQRIFRGFLKQVFYKMDLFDIIAVQTFYRQRVAAQSFRRKVRATQVIQRAIRSHFNSLVLSRQSSSINESAILCQSVIRRHLAKAVSRSLLHARAATVLQKNWRAFHLRCRFLRTLQGFVSAQALFRAVVSRRSINILQSSALLIQTSWRSYRERRSRRTYQRHLMKKRKSAILIVQALARRKLASSLVKNIRARENNNGKEEAAVVCQSVARRFLCRFAMHCSQEAAAVIQKYWRGYSALSHFSRKRANAAKLQALFRGVAARDGISCRNDCAVLLQSLWRRYWASIQYRLDLQDIIIVQSIIRRWSTTKEMAGLKSAVLVIQRKFRCCRAVHKIAVMRQHRSHLNEMNEASVRLQSFIRSRFATKKANHLRRRIKSAIIIQSVCRALHCRSRFRLARDSVRKLQQWFRLCLMKYAFSIQVCSALTIQAYWRTVFMTRTYRQKRADIVLCQSACRRHFGRVALKRGIGAAISIQCLVRKWYSFRRAGVLRSARDERGRILGRQRRFNATVLQACYRGYLARRDFENLKVQTIMVQSVWRGFISRYQYRMDVVDIILVQCAVRRRIACARLNKQRSDLHNKATDIQRCWRRYVLHMDYKILKSSASIIQSCVRDHFARLSDKSTSQQLTQRAAVRIQSRIRGYLVRISRSSQTRMAAKRINRAFRGRTDKRMCLGSRTVTALNTLRSSKSLYKITSAVKTLEVTTRFSRECCITFANGNGPDHLYDFIPNCNRSRPHIQQLSLVLSVLMNVRRYPSLLPSLATDKAAAVLVPVIQMFRETEEVFYFSTSLLYTVISVRDDLKIQCRIAENLKALEEVLELVQRMILIDHPTVSTRSSTNHAIRRSRSSDCRLRRPGMIHGLNTLRKIISESKES